MVVVVAHTRQAEEVRGRPDPLGRLAQVLQGLLEDELLVLRYGGQDSAAGPGALRCGAPRLGTRGGAAVRMAYYEETDSAVIALREPGPDTAGEIAGEDLLHPDMGENVPGS